MKRRDFYILLALAAQDRHGADISREVMRLSDAKLHLWPARLYGALDTLVTQGWLDDLKRRHQHPEGKSERRRYYRISTVGLRALRAETERLSGLVDLSRVRTEGTPENP